MWKRINKLYDKLDKLNPLFENGSLENAELPIAVVFDLFQVMYFNARVAPPKEDFTDEELTEIEAVADRLIENFRVEIKNITV